jgi:hypothetical protein
MVIKRLLGSTAQNWQTSINIRTDQKSVKTDPIKYVPGRPPK